MDRFQVSRRKVLLSLVACCLLSIPSVVAYEYFYDIIWIRLKLLGVRGIHAVELYGYDKPHYHVVDVGFEIVGKPGSVIVVHVYDTDQGLTGNPDHLYLSQLGPWTLTSNAGSVGGETMTTDKSSEGSYSACWIDVGPKGEFGAMLPVNVRNVNDIITHYDELARFFAVWPDKEHIRELILPAGKRAGYYRTRETRYPTQ